jgi:hypothetical protein
VLGPQSATAAMKQVLGARLTAVFVRQGHYADQAAGTPVEPELDFSIGQIGELAGLIFQHFQPAAPHPAGGTLPRSFS